MGSKRGVPDNGIAQAGLVDRDGIRHYWGAKAIGRRMFWPTRSVPHRIGEFKFLAYKRMFPGSRRWLWYTSEQLILTWEMGQAANDWPKAHAAWVRFKEDQAQRSRLRERREGTTSRISVDDPNRASPPEKASSP